MIEVNEQLAYIKHFLKKEKPSIADVVECYLTAADLYLQLEDADKVIECLTATEKPMFSYNNGVLFGEYINDIINMTINKIVTEQKIEKLINIGALRIEQIRLEESKETDLPSINKEYEKEINKCVGMYISEANERKKSFEEAKQTFNSEIKKQYYAIELKRNELKNLGFLSFAKKKELRVEIEKLEAQLIRYKTENYPTSLKMAFENMYMDTN